jgi:phosphocarrier protein HPr
MENMVEKKIKIVNKAGMHAKPASEFVKFVSESKADIQIIKDDRIANAKSIVNILTLKISMGSEIIVRVEGEDEQLVLEAIEDFLLNLKE